jgi:hypothetical protein
VIVGLDRLQTLVSLPLAPSLSGQPVFSLKKLAPSLEPFSLPRKIPVDLL